jgi:hypothetical protein
VLRPLLGQRQQVLPLTRLLEGLGLKTLLATRSAPFDRLRRVVLQNATHHKRSGLASDPFKFLSVREWVVIILPVIVYRAVRQRT